ncbi:MAG TPA: PKD domain-containing protein [Pyrinomonadaceae bacterium]|jgi:PKD repeat protein|nr:PKD domain-containing protein [Pyrinomonadaceae bacterium]
MLMDLSPTKSLFKSATFSFLLLSLFLLLTGNVLAQKGDASVRGLARGQAAINKLSDRLPAVALRNGKSPNELRQLLLEDSTLYVDDTNSLFYVCDAPEETPIEGAPPSPQAGPFPYNETFSLHSRPGSNRVIYLDFDGYVTTGSAWNGGQPINSAPFSIDGDPNSFNQQEQDVIQYVWQRVAEDYAPFDVDVTTQDPGDNAIIRSSASDLQYGTRVVISPTNWYGPGIGGVAYVGVFSSYGTTYKPAFVFSAALSNSEKNIAEATSHEVGHNLNLNHDGTSSSSYYTGHGDWAPIMGAGYYRSVTQWSKGEYPGANQLQDDLAIMQNYGISVIADDYGNTPAAATVLSGTNLNVSGLITTRSDVDVFQFSNGNGNVTINVNPAPRGGNLNIEAKILDSQGNVIAISNPTGLLSASFNQSLAAGVYYLTVDGVGEGDLSTGYSDYASIGQYSITGTLTASNRQPPVAVAGANVTAGFAPLTVNFSSQGSYDPDGTIVSYAWNFGDGTNSTEPNPVKVYNSAGSFTAVLTVTDNDGLTDTESILITVNSSGIICTPFTTVTQGDLSPGGIASFGVSSGPGTVTIDHIDAGTGFQALSVVSATNATVSIPAFAPGTYAPVVVTFTPVNPALAVDYTLRAASAFHAINIRVRCLQP